MVVDVSGYRCCGELGGQGLVCFLFGVIWTWYVTLLLFFYVSMGIYWVGGGGDGSDELIGGCRVCYDVFVYGQAAEEDFGWSCLGLGLRIEELGVELGVVRREVNDRAGAAIRRLKIID